MFVCKRSKINEKEAGVGPFFKKYVAKMGFCFRGSLILYT